jgi:hypothetical protein
MELTSTNQPCGLAITFYIFFKKQYKLNNLTYNLYSVIDVLKVLIGGVEKWLTGEN